MKNRVAQAIRFLCCEIATTRSVAEHEAMTISARTTAALAAAKARGTKLGSDRGNLAIGSAKGRLASAAVRQVQAAGRAADLAPVIAEIRAAGAASLREIAVALDDRGIPTARGSRWSAVQVSRVMAHAD